MRTILLIRPLFYAAIFALTAMAQNAPSQNKPLAELIYHPAGKLIYLPVLVNGAGPFMFCFDTGASHSIIDTATAQKLNIQALTTGSIRGAGKGEVTAGDAGEVRLTVGELVTRVPHANIIDLSKVPLPEQINGLLGAEFLEQYVVRIDPAGHKIAFYDAKTFNYQGQGKSLALELTNSRLYVRVGLGVKPGELVERRLRVDTGSEDSVDDDTVRKSSRIQKTRLGNGLGDSYEDVAGVYDTVAIGPFSFHNVWGPAGAVPIIGMELMRRFTLTFDARRGLLYLEPNASFNEPIPSPN
ncbi:MAG TPA: retropepsin-like aspartic protease [Candidatus Angelobacter sp.]|nr:retropepsin-like aspartic protease [Candidatus Angelobacter sp.]